MRTRALGRSGLQVSEVSLGSWLTLGSQVDYNETARLVHRAFDLGVFVFDTADVYQDGEAERALGHAIQSIPRQHVVDDFLWFSQWLFRWLIGVLHCEVIGLLIEVTDIHEP